MKKTIKIFLTLYISILLCVLSIFNIFAMTVLEIDGYIIKTDDNSTVMLSGWNGDNTNLVVPFSLNNYYINEIEDFAFKDNNKILGIDMSKALSLRRIGIMSFENCTNLSGEITIPSRINEIGMGAFQECKKITSAKLYSGSKIVPAQMFYGCSLLKQVVINYGYTNIDKLAFADCTSLKEITIPKTVTSINSSAFKNDQDLVIKGYRDSYAQQFAVNNGYDFYILDPLLGDANGDGEVDIADVSHIQRYKINDVTLNDYQMRCADVSGDGKVTIRDATLIQMKLAHMAVNF